MNVKFLKFRFLIPIAIGILAMTVISCGNTNTTQENKTDNTEQMEKEQTDEDAHKEHQHSQGEGVIDESGKEHTSAYVCSMHCKDSGSDEEGKCPVCGMDYVALAEHNKDNHTHE